MHFPVIVFVDILPDNDDRQAYEQAAQTQADYLLESYSQHLQSEETQEVCWCLNEDAVPRGVNLNQDIEELSPYDLEVLATAADPDCGCGDGINRSYHNPCGYWDWYSFGERFTGLLQDYPQDDDPDTLINDVAPLTETNVAGWRKYSPCIITADGSWYDLDDETEEFLDDVLRTHSQTTCVVVDCHT